MQLIYIAMDAVLTTEFIRSPFVHFGSCSLAGRCVRCDRLTEHIPPALIQTYIINTVFKETGRVHLSMAITKRPFGVLQDTTKLLRLIFILLAIVTIRTHPFTAFDTAWDLSHSPAGGELIWRDSFAAILWNQIVLRLPVVVAAEATNSSHVATGQFHKQSTLPVKGDFKAKLCCDHRIPATPMHRHLSITQGDRQVDQLTIHLEEETSWCSKTEIHSKEHGSQEKCNLFIITVYYDTVRLMYSSTYQNPALVCPRNDNAEGVDLDLHKLSEGNPFVAPVIILHQHLKRHQVWVPGAQCDQLVHTCPLEVKLPLVKSLVMRVTC